MRGLVRDVRLPVAVLLLGLAFVWAVNHYLFQERGYTVNAVFRDVAGLTPKSNVKIAGVNAGTVTKIVPTQANSARVTMVLPKDAAPIGAGARASIAAVNLLGEKYVDLSVGNLKRPLVSGSTIPMSRTSEGVDLDQVLDMLDADTRMRLTALINEAGLALDGRGTNFDQLLSELPPSLSQARQLVAGIGADNARLASLIEQGDQVVTAMSDKRTDLQSLIHQAEGSLTNVALKRAQLGATLQDAPATLGQAQTDLRELRTAADTLKPTAVAIQHTAPQLDATLTTLPAFTDDAVPALAALRTASPEIEDLSEGALGPVTRLAPTATKVTTFVKALAPTTQTLDDGAAVNLLRFTWGWARTTQAADGLGHVFGLRLVFDKQFLQEDVDRLLDESDAPARRAAAPKGRASTPTRTILHATAAAATPLSHTVSSLQQGATNLLHSAQGAVSGIARTVGSVAGSVGASATKVTSGLAAHPGGSSSSSQASGATQLQSVLNYLLGP